MGGRETPLRQELLGGGSVVVAIGTLSSACLVPGSLVGLGRLPVLGTTLVLMTGIVVSYQFPIHIRHGVKMAVTSIPFYLLAALLPPALAGGAAGMGFLLAELSVRRRRGNGMSTIVTHASRFAVLGLLGSVVAHLPVGGSMLRELPLLGAGIVLWTGDIVSLPLALRPGSGQRSWQLMLLVAKDGGVAEGAQYFVGLLGALVVMRQVWALLLLALPTVLVYFAFKQELDQSTLQLLGSMADTVDLRTPFTEGHSQRVTALVRGMLRELRMNGPEATLILAAARVHDLGKLGLPDQVLMKGGMLTPEEQAILESAPARGAELLGRYPDFVRGVELVGHQHERWDGAGYPDGLTGEAIPFGARMIAVADSYDAMTSDRSYRRALSPERAAAILLDGRGRQWDSQLVDVFLRTIAERVGQPVLPVPVRMVPDPSSLEPAVSVPA